MTRLEEQLEKERQQRGEEKSPEVKDQPLTPQQKLTDAETAIKLFKTQTDLDSLKLGYENFKVREQNIADREKELTEGLEKLKIDIGEFELQQKERVAKANEKADEYNKAYNLLKTEREVASKTMAEAIAKKSEADNIIKSQTETEKINQGKQEAYAENMDESIKLVAEIVKVLRQQEDNKAYSLSQTLNKDLVLIQWLLYKKAGLQTIADIIAVDCDRITEISEYLQDTKKDYSSLISYLGQSTDWLQKKLKF